MTRDEILKELYDKLKLIAKEPEKFTDFNTFKATQSKLSDDDLRKMLKEIRQMLK